MKGLFCGGCKARNNDEYRIFLKKRQKRMWILVLVGLLTVAAGTAYIGINGFEDSYTLGFVFGFGIGLALAALLSILKIQKIMRDEEKLKAYLDSLSCRMNSAKESLNELQAEIETMIA